MAKLDISGERDDDEAVKDAEEVGTIDDTEESDELVTVDDAVDIDAFESDKTEAKEAL